MSRPVKPRLWHGWPLTRGRMSDHSGRHGGVGEGDRGVGGGVGGLGLGRVVGRRGVFAAVSVVTLPV